MHMHKIIAILLLTGCGINEQVNHSPVPTPLPTSQPVKNVVVLSPNETNYYPVPLPTSQPVKIKVALTSSENYYYIEVHMEKHSYTNEFGTYTVQIINGTHCKIEGYSYLGYPVPETIYHINLLQPVIREQFTNMGLIQGNFFILENW